MTLRDAPGGKVMVRNNTSVDGTKTVKGLPAARSCNVSSAAALGNTPEAKIVCWVVCQIAQSIACSA